MQLNWGLKIGILYGGFVILILVMVCMAMNQKFDLVSKDYYEQELKYQDRIDKTDRTHALSEQMTWQVNPDDLLLKFPDQFKGKTINGTIYFFRPSDETMDKKINIAVDTSLFFRVNRDQLKKGFYKMQIDWNVNNREYYNESVIKFN
jgi:nitrogen fixation protein FixH